MAVTFTTIAAKIQKIPTKMRLIGFGVFVAILGVLFIYFYYIPMTTQIEQLNNDIQSLQKTIQANDAKIKKLDELKAEVSALRARLVILTEQLPPGSEVSGLLRQIQDLVSQSGLTLKLWRPGKQRTHSSGLYVEIPITITLVGGYNDLALLLDRVSKMTRIVNTMDLKMGGAKMVEAGVMKINISCTMMTFAAVEKKPNAASVATRKSK